jgi:site-specific DNA-methyltransferase (adenine-specific)
MSILWNGDCNELMSEVEDESVDLIFTDLPYGQISVDWDKKIDLVKMWEHFMRIKKTHTPIFFCCSTKFGVELIQSAPKKCPFRYDIVWVKSAPCGFLLAKKMPMRKHEMLYVFYEHLPFYDISSHKHKFVKEGAGRLDKCYFPKSVKVKNEGMGMIAGDNVYSKTELYRAPMGKYEPHLPTSVLVEAKQPAPLEEECPKPDRKTLYGNVEIFEPKRNGEPRYDPPLPTTILEVKSQKNRNHSTQKPVDLMKWVLKYYSKEGDVILDPTMGSGSTGVACKEMNRNFIGIEMDSEIFEYARERIEED